MSGLADFLNSQYDRIEKCERSRYTISVAGRKHCPVCGEPFRECTEALHEDGKATFSPCGHSIPIADFVDRFGESAPDPFVLADLESKRRIISECAWGGPDHYDVYEAVLRRLAAPFSGEPGYDGRWAV